MKMMIHQLAHTVLELTDNKISDKNVKTQIFSRLKGDITIIRRETESIKHDN